MILFALSLAIVFISRAVVASRVGSQGQIGVLHRPPVWPTTLVWEIS